MRHRSEACKLFVPLGCLPLLEYLFVRVPDHEAHLIVQAAQQRHVQASGPFQSALPHHKTNDAYRCHNDAVANQAIAQKAD